MVTTVRAAHGSRPAPRQTGFNSPPLVRWLASLGQAGGAPATPNPAERLSQWLDWTDAIALSAVLNAAPSPQTISAVPAPSHSPHDACLQVRRDLARAIGQDAALRAEAANAHPADQSRFAPYRTHCRALQRKMESRIGALRVEVRAALATRSAALAQLAALDAVMDQALAARAQHLLSTLPALLEQQFNRLPDDQRAGFHQQVQRVLLAELDMRLQPIDGLLEALGPAPTRHP